MRNYETIHETLHEIATKAKIKKAEYLISDFVELYFPSLLKHAETGSFTFCKTIPEEIVKSAKQKFIEIYKIKNLESINTNTLWVVWSDSFKLIYPNLKTIVHCDIGKHETIWALQFSW